MRLKAGLEERMRHSGSFGVKPVDNLSQFRTCYNLLNGDADFVNAPSVSFR
jgi:hypothetical protein